MKFTIKNEGEFDLKVLLRTGPDLSNDDDLTKNGLEDVFVKPGDSITIEKDQLCSIREMTPMGETAGFDTSYIGG